MVPLVYLYRANHVDRYLLDIPARFYSSLLIKISPLSSNFHPFGQYLSFVTVPLSAQRPNDVIAPCTRHRAQ